MGIFSQIYRLYKGADWDPKSYRDNYNQGGTTMTGILIGDAAAV